MQQMIFETNRLSIQKLKSEDEISFFDLMSNPKVMELIPQVVLTKEQSDSTLQELILLERSSDTKIYALYEKESIEFIGFCGFLK
ncbi:MAG: GNAT family N-acetyltransferase, partial [Bacteroidetes bacterium]|nr:GNAT family N-acetyltransferase [Bacteroidota bacterium]